MTACVGVQEQGRNVGLKWHAVLFAVTCVRLPSAQELLAFTRGRGECDLGDRRRCGNRKDCTCKYADTYSYIVMSKAEMMQSHIYSSIVMSCTDVIQYSESQQRRRGVWGGDWRGKWCLHS